MIFEADQKLTSAVKEEIKEKLRSIEIRISYVDPESNLKQLESFYENFNLTGDEGQFSLLKKLSSIDREKVEKDFSYQYDAHANVLYIPTLLLTHQSWFGALRPRLLNTATFFLDLVDRIFSGMEDYLKSKFINPFIAVDSPQLSYENYKSWLSKGRDDQLGIGNYTNEQLFWIILGLEDISREEGVKALERNYVGDNFFHVRYKQRQGFQEAFRCSLTQKEVFELRKCGDACQFKIETSDVMQQMLLFVLQDRIAKT